MYFIIYNNLESYDLGLKIKTRPVIPCPIKQINKIPVTGGETLYEDLEEYEDIEITVDFNFVNRENIKQKFREIKKWLLSTEDNKLFFSDDLNYFYKVNNVEISELVTTFKVKGDFSVKFTCNPYLFSVEGQREIDLPKVLNNYSAIYSKPIFRIKGEGVITLSINGNSIKFNVGQELKIDVDKELIYRDGNIENERKTGSWKDLRLISGENTLSYSLASGATLTSFKIIPNWREL